MNLRPFARRIRRALSRRDPLITVSISKEAILHNLRAYQKAYPAQKVAPVLKSNAYGHGLVLVAELLDTEDIAFLMVDSLYEARKLRRAGIRSPIVVMGYARPEEIAGSTLRAVAFAAVDIEQLRELSGLARRPISLHLKLDTGMHRQGILPEDLEEAVSLIAANPNLTLAGVATHLGDADNPDAAFSETQLSAWDSCVSRLEASFPDIPYIHAAATKGARFSAAHPMNVLRLGIGLYGFDTSPGNGEALRPALSLHSSIVSVRDIPPGDSVGYNATYTASRPSRIATVPVGYYEGLDRGLSNRGSVLVDGTACPLAGRISMNMCSVDITDAPEAARGSTVTLISDNPEDPNSVSGIARRIDTTPYVILAHIPEHLCRTLS
ncbi:MAG TPA: alanine racemase [Candidatus Paceibacterota bacterium]|nr:alanine racemase [Candidatus Paceibacterota bacterium]